MTFAVGTYKEVKETYKGNCMLCHKKFLLSNPIILQQNISGDDGITCTHLTCFMKQIQKRFPDFWKEYIVELI